MKTKIVFISIIFVITILLPSTIIAQSFGWVKTTQFSMNHQTNRGIILLQDGKFAVLQYSHHNSQSISNGIYTYDSLGNELTSKITYHQGWREVEFRNFIRDNLGNTFVTGWMVKSFKVDSVNLLSPFSHNYIIAKLDSNNVYVKAHHGFSKYNDEGYDIDILKNNQIITTGYVVDTSFFSNDTLTPFGLRDIFIATYDINLKQKTAKRFGGPGDDVGLILLTDADTNFYIGGVFTQYLPFGNDTLFSKGSGDIFIAKFDRNGNYLNSQSFGSTANDIIKDMQWDVDSNIIFTGSFYGTIMFDTLQFISRGKKDIFLASINKQYQVNNAVALGSKNDDEGASICNGPNKQIMLAANFSDTCYFGNAFVYSKSYFGSIFLNFDSLYKTNWYQTAISTKDIYSHTSVEKIISDNSGNFILTGSNYRQNSFGNIKIKNWPFERGYRAKIFSGIVVYNTGKNICQGDSVHIAFAPNFLPDSGNVFSLWLSDSSGSFDNPRFLGSISGIAADTFHVVIDSILASSSSYLFRVTSSLPVSGGFSLKSYSLQSPNVYVSGPSILCAPNYGIMYVKNANLGTYQWLLNDTIIQGAIYSSYIAPPGQYGDYSCIVTNTCFNDTSSHYLLIPTPKPTFSFQFPFDTLLKNCYPTNSFLYLDSLVSPIGGYFSGFGILNNNTVNISTLTYNTNYAYTYHFTDSITKCVYDTTAQFYFYKDNYIQFVNLPADICKYNAPIPLNTTYPGGTFSSTCANCIQGNTFDPSFGNAATAYDISYSVMGKYNCIETIKESIFISVCTGMNDNDVIKNITVTNFINHVNIESKDGFAVYDKWQMIDLTGRIIMENNIQNNSEKLISIDTQKLNNGIYSLIFFDDNTNATFKVHVLK